MGPTQTKTRLIGLSGGSFVITPTTRQYFSDSHPPTNPHTRQSNLILTCFLHARIVCHHNSLPSSISSHSHVIVACLYPYNCHGLPEKHNSPLRGPVQTHPIEQQASLAAVRIEITAIHTHAHTDPSIVLSRISSTDIKLLEMARGQKKANANGGTGASTPKAEETVQASNPVTETAGPSSSATDKPTINGTHDAKLNSNGYTREIEKRLAKWSKKKRGIETIEAKIAGLTPQEVEITKLINNDERKKLAEKPQVEERVKEYQDLLVSLSALVASEEKAKAAEKEAAEADIAAKIEEAKKAGYEEGIKAQKEVLLTCFRFLRLAGYRRAVPDENVAENEAIEKVLVMVYSSEDSATAAIESLAASKDEAVEGSEGVTYARIKEIAETLYAGEEEAAEPLEETVTQVSNDLGDSTVIVTASDAENTPHEPAPQTLVDPVEPPSTAPVATLVDDAAANAAATAHPPEGAEATEDWDNVKAGGQSSDNGGAANGAPTASWADQAHDESAKAESETPAQPAEEAFQEVPSRSHGGRGRGFRGRGEFRGNFRGGPRGGFRGRGEGYRGRGEFRGGEHRGGFRGRGDRPYRPRGDRGGQDAPAPAQTAA
ncbi:hypothetical protein TWF696_009321 [Orbilia brochopaga]|uniref:YAG7-like dimerisation domain-containing protein n=1 Tax=Orbilia brochopaga TaxID=3140254 RepID=A0AAV9UII2_9PEZI